MASGDANIDLGSVSAGGKGVAEAANNCQSVVKQLQSTSDNLQSHWDSNTGKKFKASLDNDIKPKINKCANTMHETHDRLTKILQSYHQLDNN
ncbi:MAG TPA: WXG100 family type VII secretion target [Stackebrandtia sp.]|jgi:WXG100 family type VII secretion target|uniref:WXG100 family type VII secretion target n=1 Tax=Stackebrandtia sp. TaxID=2023065 RepID=UPI002D6A8CC4|nr:WXG100 family type VII secretion target [Stackebrandtia sp.]HZE37525.1 WXG100 family type VII secretion target [Stackebrandtia sp.]